MSTINIFAQELKVKERIVLSLHNLDGIITQEKLNLLSFDLKELSQDSSMCFITLGANNNCEGMKADVYSDLMRYMDDLLCNDVTVYLTKWNKPWEDENFYTLRFEILYRNTDVNSPSTSNFDTLILDVSEDQIKSIMYGREWIDLVTYGE